MAPSIVDVVSPHVVEEGSSAPLGATILPGGVNFSVFSKNAEAIELLLFDDQTATAPARIIPLDAKAHRTYHYWHAFVPGLKPGQVYGYRAHGPFAPERGLRFDAEKVLLDPYGLAMTVPNTYDRLAASRPGGNAASWPIPPVTTGKAISRSSGPSPRPSSTNSTCARDRLSHDTHAR